MSSNTYPLPKVASREEWLSARKALLLREKELTRQRDALNAARRRLPIVKIEKQYVLEGPRGKLPLIDAFEGRRQLYIHHFMWIDALDTGCPQCTRTADMTYNSIPFLAQLQERDITFAAVARAPYAKLASFIAHRGWIFPFYSSHGTSFNVDFGATLDEAQGPIEYNYRDKAELTRAGLPAELLHGDWPGHTILLRDGATVYHAYSSYARGLDTLFAPYNFLDLTPYGRQEEWEDSPEGWPQRPTYG
jgi:predicted dithiol-disulfide oxidoreductase (DUF899 family)